MRKRTRQLPLLLVVAGIMPFATDAAIAVPTASKEQACVQADPPFPRKDGDEKFFDIASGVPNVMILLDNSGSMQDFPTDIPYPSSWPASGGTCTTSWDVFSAKLSATPDTPPYDNGFTGLVNDAPTWAYPQCAGVANPTGDAVADNCLFRGGGAGGVAYYKYYGNAGGMGGLWDAYRAGVYNTTPCAVVDSDGTIQRNWSGAIITAPDLNECRTCLATKGYYLFRRSGSTTPQAVFRGDFLNVNPPKFVIARKVVKDVARIDAANPSALDQVRLGLTVFTAGSSSGTSSGLRSADGGTLVVPLGPNCTDAVPPTQAAYAPPRQVVVNSVNNPSIVAFSTMTPLAETLFNIGQYFGDSARYTNLFGSTWVRANFNNSSAGTTNASWATASGERQDSFCWWCQQSSVVIVTDGEPTNDDNLPKYPTVTTNHTTFNNNFRRWSNSTIDCPACGGFALHKVAYFLNQTDMRLDLEGGRPQTVSTYTISFGLNASSDATAIALLQKTADLGGGLFRNTSSGTELATALNEAVTDVVARSTSFSSANANAIQTSRTTQADAYVARFKPNGTAAWEGHVFGAMLFDEFGQGCDSNFGTSGQKPITCGTRSGVNPNLNGDSDTDGHALCTGAYLVDKDCDPIVEDATGSYKKGSFDSAGALATTPDDANMFWDAGKVLSDPTQPGYKTAEEGLTNSRKIYTTIDRDADGKLASADELVDFTADNAAALAPSMSLDAEYCIQLMTDAHFCGVSPMPACPTTATFTTANRTTCAQIVINYVRGWDVLDSDGDHCYGPGAWDNTHGWGSCTTAASCGAPAQAKGVACTSGQCVYSGACTNGEQRDRVQDHRTPSTQTMWKLGDVFHSSPFLMKRPIDKVTCYYGTVPQCFRTIYSPQEYEGIPTPMETYGMLDAYEAWRQDTKDRDQIVLVGANDGMLHAFHAGSTNHGAAPNLEGMYPYDNGTGSELWAYIPPDLLPKLKKSVYAHHYFVDATPMVRDVWVDLNGDGRKQRNEFRSVAVIGERLGGSRWSALDVSDPSTPRFLWHFPDGCTEDSVLAGESWSEYLPWSPPIVPVRMRPTGGDPSGRGYDEKWVVLINGGYDPALIRGRAVWMLDVWTGQKVWQFTDADFKAMRGDANASMFPVAATMVGADVGRGDGLTGNLQIDGMVDTAVWADVGGNVFVARLYEVGQPGANGLVQNWTAARTFEEARRTDDLQFASGRASFFHMPATYDEPAGKGLRILLGSGNRARLMDPRPVCGPDDVFGCARAGCAASAVGSTSYGSGSCSASGTFSVSGGQLSYSSSSSACSGSYLAPGPVTRQTTLNATCGTDTLSVTASRSCDTSGLCAPAPYKDIPFASSANFTPSSLPAPTSPARFYSFWGYGFEQNKRFGTAAQARVFEANRFTDVAFSGCSNWPASGGCKLVEVANAEVVLSSRGNFTPRCQDGATKCMADKSDPGWMFTYGKWCTLGPGQCLSTPPWYDEQTGAIPGGAFGCVIWSGFRPTGSTASSDACTTSAASPTSFTYFADQDTGVPTLDTGAGKLCGIAVYDSSTTPPPSPSGGHADDFSKIVQLSRGVQKNAFSAPQSAALRVTVNEQGQVNYSALSIDTGSAPTKYSLGTRSSAAEPLYWLEVPRETHTCRHVDASTCK